MLSRAADQETAHDAVDPVKADTTDHSDDVVESEEFARPTALNQDPGDDEVVAGVSATHSPAEEDPTGKNVVAGVSTTPSPAEQDPHEDEVIESVKTGPGRQGAKFITVRESAWLDALATG